MTFTPEYASPVRNRPWAPSEMLSWLVILLAIAAVLVTHFVLSRTRPAARTGPERPSVKLLLPARVTIGMHQLFPKEDLRKEVRSLELQATTETQRFHVAIVRAAIEHVEDYDLLLPVRSSSSVLAGDIQLIREFQAGRVPLDSQAVQEFRRRNGWFGDLALAQTRPQTDPFREQTFNAGVRTIGAIAAFVVLGGIAGLAGIVLVIVGIVLFVQRKIVPVFAQNALLPQDRRTCVQGFALYLATMVGLGLLLRLLAAIVPMGMWVNFVFMPLALAIGLFWPLFRGQTFGEWRQAVGLHTGKGVLREIFSGVAGYCAGIPFIVLGILATLLLSRISGAQPAHPIVEEATSAAPRLLLWLFLASVWAPITEELMFRGMLFAHLRERHGFWISALGVALVFAIIHPQGWAGVPTLATIAMVLAAIREWRGSIIGSVVAHAINNTAVMLMLIGAVS